MDAQKADALIYPGWANPARLVGDYDSPLGDLSQIIPPNTGMPGIVVPMVSCHVATADIFVAFRIWRQ